MVGGQIGDYRIVRELGSGRAGVVFLGEAPGRGEAPARAAAIKVLAIDGDGRPRAERYLGDAEAAASLRHPAIVEVMGRGFSADGRAYLIMELLDGVTLRTWMGGGATPELPMALDVARRLAATLGAAHERQIVHGGLRPENVFLVGGRPDALKITDFGLGRLLGTGPAATAAEVAYLSPERCRRSDRIDVSDDVYAFGCLLYELCCGRPPFPHVDRDALIAAHVGQPVPAPRGVAPWLPPSLERLLQSMLSKSPGERPRQLRWVEEALARIATGTAEVAGEQGWPATREQASAPRLTPLGHKHVRPPQQRGAIAGVGSARETPPRRTPLGQAHLHLRSLVVDHGPRTAGVYPISTSASSAEVEAEPPQEEPTLPAALPERPAGTGLFRRVAWLMGMLAAAAALFGIMHAMRPRAPVAERTPPAVNR